MSGSLGRFANRPYGERDDFGEIPGRGGVHLLSSSRDPASSEHVYILKFNGLRNGIVKRLFRLPPKPVIISRKVIDQETERLADKRLKVAGYAIAEQIRHPPLLSRSD